MALNKKGSPITVENTISNTSVNIIQITEDKLENILIKHINKLKKAHNVLGVFSLFVTLLATMFTTQFQNIWGLNADVWKGIFIMLTLGSFIYLVYVICNYFANRESVQSILSDIKKTNKEKE